MRAPLADPRRRRRGGHARVPRRLAARGRLRGGHGGLGPRGDREGPARRDYAIYFVDLKMPGGIDGIETMMEIRKLQPDASVIIITAYATVDTAITAMKEGAQEYIVKPCNPQEISLLVAADHPGQEPPARERDPAPQALPPVPLPRHRQQEPADAARSSTSSGTSRASQRAPS